MEKEYLSFTQLSMFLRCPAQYRFRYIEGLKIPPSGAMVQSRVWHETLEENYRQKIGTDKDLPLSVMQEFFSARYDEVFRTEEIRFEKAENAGNTAGALFRSVIDPFDQGGEHFGDSFKIDYHFLPVYLGYNAFIITNRDDWNTLKCGTSSYIKEVLPILLMKSAIAFG